MTEIDLKETFRQPAAMMAAIRDVMMENGFTRRESVGFAGTWLLHAMTSQANADKTEFADFQALLAKLKISGPPA